MHLSVVWHLSVSLACVGSARVIRGAEKTGRYIAGENIGLKGI